MISDETWRTIATERGRSVEELMESAAKIDAALEAKGLRGLHYFDRDGDPITVGIWAELYESWTYRLLETTTLVNGIWVATIWLGGEGDDGCMPRFETSAFRHAPGQDRPLGELLAQMEDLTEAAARMTHSTMAAAWVIP